MAEIHSLNLDNLPSHEPEKSEIVFAKFHDGKYYRARVVYLNKKNENETLFKVLFIDYGNTAEVSKESIRVLDFDKYGMKALPGQALVGRLAYVKTPKFDQDYGEQAANLFKDLVYEQELVAKYWIDRSGYCLKLGVPSKKIFVNIQMIIEGFARVARSRTEDPIYKSIQEEEEIAKKSLIGIWLYGTVPDSDEEKEEELEKKRSKTKEKKGSGSQQQEKH